LTALTKPPRTPALLLSLFSGEPDFRQIEGDLSEEFHSLLLARGPKDARRWYWREVRRNLWVLLKRPSTIQVLAVAALSVFIFKFAAAGPFFRWLQTELYSAPRIPGLRLILMTVFETMVAMLLGGLMSQLLKGREPLLRMAFTACFLLFLLRNHLLISLPFNGRLALMYVSPSFILLAFWIGSLLISRRRPQRLAR